MFKENKGITLIALVVTIIVLLILAGVAISMITGENGILRQAANAKETTEQAAKQEEAELLKQELYMAKSLGGVSKEKLEGMGFTVYGIDSKYAAIKDELGLIIDESGDVLAESSNEIVYDIYMIKQSYLTYKENSPEEKASTLTYPYSNLDQYESNNSSLIEKIGNSYKSNKYTMSLQRGNLVCLYNPDIMTEEKISVCEGLGIYYLGDVDGNHVIDWWDAEELSDYINTTRDKRRNIVCDVRADANDTVNNIDVSELKGFLSKITKEIGIISNLIDEYDNYVDENGLNDNDAYKEINAKTDEELKQYINTYSSSLNLPYQLIIQRGEPYWLYDKTKIYPKSYIKATGISILGDANSDGKIDEGDLTRLNTYINRSNYIERCDLNNDGVLDEEDAQLLNEMIN